MADEQKNNGVLWISGLVIAAVISVGAAVFSQSGKTSQANQQSLIDDLPAVRAKLDILNDEVAAIKKATLSRGEIQATLKAIEERLGALEGQISRRFQEVVIQPLKILRDDVEKNEDSFIQINGEIEAIKAEIKNLKSK